MAASCCRHQDYDYHQLEDSPSGKLLDGVLESIDEFYSANLGQDIKRGIREAARRGFFVGSRPPPGLHRVPVKEGPKTRYTLEPDPDDAATTKTVRRMFDMAAKNIGTKDIAKTLNHDGFFTSTGQHWGKTTVHKILTNEAYCGTLVLGGRPGHLAIRSGEPRLDWRMHGHLLLIKGFSYLYRQRWLPRDLWQGIHERFRVFIFSVDCSSVLAEGQ